MTSCWTTVELNSEAHIVETLVDLKGKQWLSRGQSKLYGALVPSIDRFRFSSVSRPDKLLRERESIDRFRETARFFADDGEREALVDDIVTLMVLRHYGVPTRLLDWSQSPFVAAYFSVCADDAEDAELWSFDFAQYLKKGDEQWQRWPETTKANSGLGRDFDAKLTAFLLNDPPDWVVAAFYSPGFPRQNAQSGAFTLAARFCRDHAEVLKDLLGDQSKHHRYVIPARFKPFLRNMLRENHGIWRGTLFPDSAGAADTARSAFDR